MSKQKYMMIISLFVILIISVTAVSAFKDTNNTATDILEDVSPNSEYDLGLSDSEVKGTLEGSTFEDIQSEIDNAEDGATIDLNGNFISTGSEIKINKSLTINGHKSTTLDAKGLSSFIYLDHVPKLTVSGVKFINGLFYGDAVVRWDNGFADEYSFTDCDFENNTGYFLDISSKKATFTNCNFLNNDNNLFMLDSDSLTVSGCNFIKNKNQLISRAKTIDRCTFRENDDHNAYMIDNAQSITNSIFIKNYFTIVNVNSMYNNNFESNNGGYSLVENAGSVDKCVFNKNIMLIFKKCNTLKNSRFQNNYGDAVYSGGSVSNCRFTDNTGWYSFLGVSSITNSYFKNNKDCFIKNKKLILKNSQFINTKGYVSGRKIDKCSFFKCSMDFYADSISNCKFKKNIFKAYTIDANSVKKCQFIQNKCKNAMLGAKTVSNSIFKKNVCDFSLMGATKSISNCRFEKNTCAKKGSASLVEGSKLLKNCVFTSNIGKKGSMVCDVGTVKGCTFKNNKITDFAYGTVYFVKNVLNSKFINNKAFHGTGGAIEEVNVVKKCTFKNNYALAGGAISTVGKITIEKCTFIKNKAKHSGSAIYLTSLPCALKGVIKDCKFSKNTAKGKINPFDYPFKNYNKGTIFLFGDHKIKIKVIKCKGL